MIDRDRLLAEIETTVGFAVMSVEVESLADRILALDVQQPDDLAQITMTPQTHRTRHITAVVVRDAPDWSC